MISKSASHPAIAARVNNLEQKIQELQQPDPDPNPDPVPEVSEEDIERFYKVTLRGAYGLGDGVSGMHYKNGITIFGDGSANPGEGPVSFFYEVFGVPSNPDPNTNLGGFNTVISSTYSLADLTIGDTQVMSNAQTSLAKIVTGNRSDIAHLIQNNDYSITDFLMGEINEYGNSFVSSYYPEWHDAASLPGYFYKVIFGDYDRCIDLLGSVDDFGYESLAEFICYTNIIIDANENVQNNSDKITLARILFGSSSNQQKIMDSTEGSFFRAVFGPMPSFVNGGLIDGAFYGKNSLWKGVSDKIAELEARISALEGS